MSRLHVNGIDLHYAEQGQGPALLLIHGLGSCLEDWQPQIQAFSATHRVVAFDLRGHGASEQSRGPYSIPLFAADAAGLLAGLGIAAAHVVGVSLGGCIAFQLALDHPGCVASLVIVNSAPEFVRRSLGTRLEIIRRTLLVRWRGLRRLGERISERLLPGPAHAAQRAAFIARFARNSPEAYLASLKSLVGWSVTDRLDAIRCPVLVVGSEHDYTAVAAKEQYTRRIPGARFVVVPDARHALPVERPAVFNARLAEFLASLETAPPRGPPAGTPGA